ncbi:MAG: hypothetical protein R3189_01840 [Thiomicrorhabdus chilensis]|uniref:hypothetical protein n=1 Tax=Thiomicrorhabdus chilensis TaxID=63656 RepID=UPI00299F0CD8|nr:hypothetical protein [Thiomicrorhabdus chilensis]MDX1346970.1 hypothetical protein [Thiomicrorhabdus chilensis]
MRDFTIDLCEKNEREQLIQGEPSSYSYVPYMEAHFKIGCSALNKAGIFKQSCKGGISYFEGMSFEVEFKKSDSPFLFDVIYFRYKLNNERYIETSFGIDWQERTFGAQPYFVCDKTGKRVKHLLVVEGLLRTRHQLPKMHYYSEHESVLDRDFRAARKIRRRFNKDTAIFSPMLLMTKPDNIHYKTWDKWCFKELSYFNRIFVKQAEFLDKLERGIFE